MCSIHKAIIAQSWFQFFLRQIACVTAPPYCAQRARSLKQCGYIVSDKA